MTAEGVADVVVYADEAGKHDLANAIDIIIEIPQITKTRIKIITKIELKVGMMLPKSTETRGVG